MLTRQILISATFFAAIFIEVTASPFNEASKATASYAQANTIALIPKIPDAGSGKELRLTKQENFYWHHVEQSKSWPGQLQFNMRLILTPSTGIVTNMTIATFPDFRMLNGEKFGMLVESIDCRAEESIKVRFASTQDMKDAENSWAWVNKNLKNKIIYTIDGKDCGGKNGRQPYYIKSITYDENAKIASMDSEIAHWPEFARDAVININGLPAVIQPQKAHQEHRALYDITSKETMLTANLDHQVPRNTQLIQTNVKNVDIDLRCVDCHSKGKLEFDMTISLADGFRAQVVAQNNVAFHMALGLTVSRQFGGDSPVFEKSIRVFETGISGLSIPNVLEVGPSLAIDVQASIQDISGSVTAGFGAEMSIPNGNKFAIRQGSTNINPKFELTTASISGNVTMVTRVNPFFTINMECLFLTKGIVGGLGLAAPTLDLTTSVAAHSEGKTCSNDNSGTKSAIKLALDVGVQVSAFGGFTGSSNTPNKQVIFDKSTNLFTTCVPVGR